MNNHCGELGCFLVLRKLLFVSFCVVVWVLFSVFSIFCITSLVSATPRNHRELVGFLFRAALWFGSDFVYAKFPETNVMLSFYLLAIFTVKSNDSVSFSCFLVFCFLR